MASTDASVLPSFTPTLAHSLNSRGELGMFVNPYACSCTTCVDYVAAREEPAAAAPPPAPLSLTSSVPILVPPRPIGEVAVAEAMVDLHRAAVVFSPPPLARTLTGFHYSPPEDDGIAPTESISATGPLYPSLGPTESTPLDNPWLGPSTESIGPGTGAGGSRWSGGMGLGMASSRAGVVRFWTPIPRSHRVTLTATQMLTFKKMLTDYKQLLEEQQEGLDHSGCRSHDEMAAQDAEWTELDEKITELDEIYGLLLAAENL
jgi:hypothetical protein